MVIEKISKTRIAKLYDRMALLIVTRVLQSVPLLFLQFVAIITNILSNALRKFYELLQQ